jgi:hypothetical protein
MWRLISRLVPCLVVSFFCFSLPFLLAQISMDGVLLHGFHQWR